MFTNLTTLMATRQTTSLAIVRRYVRIVMQEKVEAKGALWVMPIRKLAPLPYPFEQLHGRCAALAERIEATFEQYPGLGIRGYGDDGR